MINKNKLSKILLYFAIFLLATSCSTNDNKEKLPHQDLSFMGYALGHRLSNYFPDCFNPDTTYECVWGMYYYEREGLYVNSFDEYRIDTLYGRILVSLPFQTKMPIEGRDSLKLNVTLHALDDSIFLIDVRCLAGGCFKGSLRYDGMKYLAELMKSKYGESNEEFHWEFENCWIGGHWNTDGKDTTCLNISYRDRAMSDEVSKLYDKKENDKKKAEEQKAIKAQQLRKRQIKGNLDKI